MLNEMHTDQASSLLDKKWQLSKQKDKKTITFFLSSIFIPEKAFIYSSWKISHL